MNKDYEEFQSRLIPDTDFDLHNEENVLHEIMLLDDFLHEHGDELSLFQLVNLETRLKYRTELLKEIRMNRCDFQFKEDLIETTSTSPIDIALRDKLKDENYKGYIKKDKANEMIRKINEKADQ